MKERRGREAERLFLLSCWKYKHVRRRISSSVGWENIQMSWMNLWRANVFPVGWKWETMRRKYLHVWMWLCVCVCVNPRVDMHTLCLNEVCLGGKWHANMQLTLRGMLTSRPETEAGDSCGSNSKLYVQFDSLRDCEESLKIITLRYFCFWLLKTEALETLHSGDWNSEPVPHPPVHAQTSTSSSRWRRSSVVTVWTVMMMWSANHTETHH